MWQEILRCLFLRVLTCSFSIGREAPQADKFRRKAHERGSKSSLSGLPDSNSSNNDELALAGRATHWSVLQNPWQQKSGPSNAQERPTRVPGTARSALSKNMWEPSTFLPSLKMHSPNACVSPPTIAATAATMRGSRYRRASPFQSKQCCVWSK